MRRFSLYQLILQMSLGLFAVVSLFGCSAEDDTTLRIMSYNVKGFDWGVSSLPNFPIAPDTTDLLETINAYDPDIIAIQESWKKTDTDSLAHELAAATGLEHIYAVSVTELQLPFVQQNVLLSRFPFEQTERLDLGEDPTSTGNRFFLYTRVKLRTGKTVQIANLHLFTDDTLQLPALKKIESYLQKNGDDTPLFWAGDFNFKPESDRYQYLIETFTPSLKDPVSQEQINVEAQYTSNAKAPHQRIDFIFTSPEVEVLEYKRITSPINNRTYPDHLPVLLETKP